MDWIDKVLGGQHAKEVVDVYRTAAQEVIKDAKKIGLTPDETTLLIRINIEVQEAQDELPVLITDSMIDLIEYEIYNLWTDQS